MGAWYGFRVWKLRHSITAYAKIDYLRYSNLRRSGYNLLHKWYTFTSLTEHPLIVITLEQITELIEHRRTIKPIDANGEPNYLDKPIPQKTLEQLLENANWAPTHGLTEPWRFTIFQDLARENLALKLSQTYTQHLLPVDFSQAKHDKLIANAKHTSAAIALGMQRHVGKIPVEEEVIAVACAVQNLHLAATAAQLGGFWSTSPIYDLPEMRDYFGFNGSEDRCLGIFYLGYPRNLWPTRKRVTPGDLSKKTNWRK